MCTYSLASHIAKHPLPTGSDSILKLYLRGATVYGRKMVVMLSRCPDVGKLHESKGKPPACPLNNSLLISKPGRGVSLPVIISCVTTLASGDESRRLYSKVSLVRKNVLPSLPEGHHAYIRQSPKGPKAACLLPVDQPLCS